MCRPPRCLRCTHGHVIMSIWISKIGITVMAEKTRRLPTLCLKLLRVASDFQVISCIVCTNTCVFMSLQIKSSLNYVQSLSMCDVKSAKPGSFHCSLGCDFSLPSLHCVFHRYSLFIDSQTAYRFSNWSKPLTTMSIVTPPPASTNVTPSFVT